MQEDRSHTPVELVEGLGFHIAFPCTAALQFAFLPPPPQFLEKLPFLEKLHCAALKIKTEELLEPALPCACLSVTWIVCAFVSPVGCGQGHLPLSRAVEK